MKKSVIAMIVVVLAIIALLLGNGLRQRPNLDAGNTTAPGSTQSSPVVTTAPPTTVPTTAPTTVPATTAPLPTEPENRNIVVITRSWNPFVEDAPEFGEIEYSELTAYHLLQCKMEGTSAVYGGLASSLYWAICFTPEILETDLQNAAVTYDVRVNYGEMIHFDKDDMRYVQDGNHAVYAAGQTFLWQGHDLWCMTTDELGLVEVLAQVGGVWIDVVVKVDDNIVGCAVFEIIPYQNFGLTAQYVCSEYYPQINGRYQEITEEFVQKRLEAIHQG